MHRIARRGTYAIVTVQGIFAGLAAASANVGKNWRELRDSGDLQFAPIPPIEKPEAPGWLERFFEWLRELIEPLGRALGMSWPVAQNVLLALGILLALLVLWFFLKPIVDRWRLRDARPAAEEEWMPDRDAAVALLEDADRLARAGQFEEAVHLLLQRSVRHIADARPEWLLPASTAREIAAFPMLPDKARQAFALIAGRVEKSLFALRALNEADWAASRAAYADFALADLSR